MKFIVTDVTVKMSDNKQTKYLVSADLEKEKTSALFSSRSLNDAGEYLNLEFYANGKDGFEDVRPGDTFELELIKKEEIE